MNVRSYQPKDNSDLARLFAETIRSISQLDYSPVQLEVWASNAPDMDRWVGQIRGRLVLVAEHNSEIAGFTPLEPSGHLDHLYVHRLYQRRGVASVLLRRIEVEGRQLGIRRLFTEASVNARPFFECAGFRLIGPEHASVRGASFLRYRMDKLLS